MTSDRPHPAPTTTTATLDELYSASVLAFAANIPRLGRLAAPNASATAHSRLCGSTVTVDIVLDGETVVDFGHEVRACVLGQAAASIMARNVVGVTAGELLTLRETMVAMLTADGPPPDGRFGELRYLEPVRGHRSRHASTLLAFDAVAAALGQAARPQSSVASTNLHQSPGVIRSDEALTWQRGQGRGAIAC